MSARNALLAAALAAALGAAAALPDYRGPGPVSWVCAGVGADERRALDALRARADLEITFVSAKRGGYLAGVEFAVRDEAGVAVARGTADGPMCFVDAPPGRYRVEARLGEATRSARAVVPREAGKAARLVLAFPDEPWDGIRATAEEKAQAAAP